MGILKDGKDKGFILKNKLDLRAIGKLISADNQGVDLSPRPALNNGADLFLPGRLKIK